MIERFIALSKKVLFHATVAPERFHFDSNLNLSRYAYNKIKESMNYT